MNLETILNVCQTDVPVIHWIQFSHSFFDWLRRSSLNFLVLGGLLIVSFLIVSGLLMRGFTLLGRGRSIKRLWIWGFPVAFFLSISPLLIGEPLLTQFLPTYEGQTADAVVVLGRGKLLRTNRVAEAAYLISGDRSPRVFLSGYGDSYGMAIMLNQLGIPPSKISGESCSHTTEQNAQYTAQLLLPDGVKSIILISDPAHLLRSQLVFRSLGFEVIPYPSPLPRNIGLRHRRLLAMRESLGLISYGLMGRYWPRTIAAVETTVAQ
ncbi:MAG: YdcF family protein [Leptolyngbyaceae cyanobacterium MAG.088]|nr:YdcF family protein [Leptolyngbyaceae cyanobacterium MAG.088]